MTRKHSCHGNSARWIYLCLILASSPPKKRLYNWKTKPDKHDTEALATVLNCRAKQAAKAKTSCKRKRCSKIASVSKRRCLSSLEFSPLNLSLFHPCKLFQQTHTIQQGTKENWHFCSFSAVLHKLQESWVQQLFQAYMAMVESRFAGEAYSNEDDATK